MVQPGPSLKRNYETGCWWLVENWGSQTTVWNDERYPRTWRLLKRREQKDRSISTQYPAGKEC